MEQENKCEQQEEFDLKREVDCIAEELTQEVFDLATDCVRSFGGRSKTQITNLERIGLSVRRYGELIAYVMRQTGKERKAGQGWRTLCGDVLFGQKMIAFLEKLQQKTDQCYNRYKKEGEKKKTAEEEKPSPKRIQAHHQNELRIQVAHICLRNLNSAYQYKLVQSEENS